MQRREFLTSAAAASLGATTLGSAQASLSDATVTSQNKPFKLKYAPHFGMFRNHAKDLIDQLKFMHDQGFRALEDNFMARRPVAEQNKIAKEMERLGMEMGVFIGQMDFGKVTFGSKDKNVSKKLVADLKKAVEVAKRVRAKWCTVVPGKLDQRTEPGFQTANAIDNLRRCAEICEPSGLVMVLEPLNPWRDHPGLFLSKIPHAYEICRGVNSPSVKILNDLYHQQITEGNLIPNIDKAWSEIGYFQTGDNPGRKEPTTGEINYLNVFRHIHRKGFKGIIGMEHGNSKPGKEGEMAVVKAYQACDAF